jgi:hypothetical protein
MQYKYVKQQSDYSDLSSGRVFYSLPGHPAFPVRLASEIFQRCLAYREREYGTSAPVILYDPCCGAAYHISVLSVLHADRIRAVIGSDIDEKAVALAGRNLGLLNIAGMDQRLLEIAAMSERFGKESHKAALASAAELKNRLAALRKNSALETKVFRASALDKQAISRHIEPHSVDIVFTDVPYGQHSNWRDHDFAGLSDPMVRMLDALLETLSPTSILAVASDKQQKVRHAGFRRIEQFLVGKRRVVILKTA